MRKVSKLIFSNLQLSFLSLLRKFEKKIKYFCEQSSSWNNRVCSIKFIQWYHHIKSMEYLCKTAAGETEWGVRGEKKERMRGAD